MLIAAIAIVIGLVGLFWGADKFVDGAAATAYSLGVSPLIVGLTIVALGTSSPEMLVALFAALDGASSIAIGNVIGSNIANIGLVVGGTALIAPLTVHPDTLRRDYPLLLVITLLAAALMLDGELEWMDGLILLAGLILSLTWMLWLGVKESLRLSERAQVDEDPTANYPAEISVPKALLSLLIGFVILVACSRLLVWGAVQFAELLGISQLVIGLTIVAIGTSLPELAASIAGVLKDQHDITIGNIVGSNLFNLLAVLCIPGLVAPTQIEKIVLLRDLPIMGAFTLLLWIVIRRKNNLSMNINRWGGGILMLCFSLYIIWLVMVAHVTPHLV
ncbi:MAG TPA: calcium/sodium antiporter [Gammaproteobacteria bacterium]|nr:calcium/sodium antiporter [Gammaproteobacteria bacterium]